MATTQVVNTSVNRPIIAIFEGLHAERFDNSYTKNFFYDLQSVAKEFQKFQFILKPHPNVLTRSPEHILFLKNLRKVNIIDPNSNNNTINLLTSELLAVANAIITTPSTICLDAAMANTPVAVTRYDQPKKYYEIYKPLPLLNNVNDWREFLRAAEETPQHIRSLTKNFLHRRILPGNAAKRIVKIIETDSLSHRTP